jgi:5-methylcytosine-specific restriction endonuclease McrA
MPIRESEKARYPKDWPEISQRVRARADNRCEFCGVRNGWLGGRTRDGTFYRANPIDCGGRMPALGSHSWCTHRRTGQTAQLRIIRIVLTVAHLDHTPENCADENLKALCQRCHLSYDAKHHARNAAETRRKARADGDLFESER